MTFSLSCECYLVFDFEFEESGSCVSWFRQLDRPAPPPAFRKREQPKGSKGQFLPAFRIRPRSKRPGSRARALMGVDTAAYTLMSTYSIHVGGVATLHTLTTLHNVYLSSFDSAIHDMAS